MEFGVIIPEGGNLRKSKYRDMYKEFVDSAEITARANFDTVEAANSARNVLNKIAKDDGNIVELKRIGTYVYFAYRNMET